MIYLLAPIDIPMFWEAIKKTEKDANNIQEDEMSMYMTELLHSLLSSDAQCFIRLDENRTLEALAVTRILMDKKRCVKYLFVQSLFSWQIRQPDVWQADFDFMLKFAKSKDCQYITCESDNPHAWQLYERIGMEEEHRVYSVKI